MITKDHLARFITETNGGFGFCYDGSDGHSSWNKQKTVTWASTARDKKEALAAHPSYNFASFGPEDLAEMVNSHGLKSVEELEKLLDSSVNNGGYNFENEEVPEIE